MSGSSDRGVPDSGNELQDKSFEFSTSSPRSNPHNNSTTLLFFETRMFISRIVLFALPVFAAATAVPRANGNNGNHGNNGNNGNHGNNNNNNGNNGGTTNTGGNNSCNQGTSQFCCNNVQSATALSADNKWLLGILGVNTNSLIGQVGLACNPAAGASASCNSQSVCCQSSQGSGIIVNNCSPVIINV